MILSNNAFKFFKKFKKDTIKRINIAWVESKEELIDVILKSEHYVFFDYPYGRTKLPVPKFDVVEAVNIANSLKSKIWCFAISNAEDEIFLKTIRSLLDQEIKMIPKIESPIGIENLKEIMKACDTDTIMLDKEDLSTHAGNDQTVLSDCLNTLKQKAKKNKYKILGLQGVIFDYITI